MKKMNIAKTGPADLLPQKFVITNVLGVPLRSSPVFILLFILLFGLFGLFVTFNNTSSLTYSNNIDLEYSINTTLDVSFSTGTGFVIDDLTPGTAAYSNTVTVTASSNNSDGFTMSATAGNSSDVNRNNNRLVNNSDNTNYFDSIATNANIAELTNLGDNKWGYAICDDIGTSNNTNTTTNTDNTTSNACSTWSNYNGLPAIGNTGTPLVDMNKAGSTSVDMRIGASATNTQVSGMFTNNVNFTITAKVVTYDYIITYSANDGNPTSDGNNTVDTSNMPSNTSGSLQTGQTLLVSNQVPTRTGYEFLGWCDGVVDRSNCNGVAYQPSNYIKIANASSVNNNTVTLSSIWCMTTITGTMQDFNPCDDLPINATGTLQDARDNQNYTIAKLKDGKWWMTSNLALDLTALTQTQLYGTGGNAGKMTNASNEALGYLKGATAGTASDKWAMAPVKKTWTSSYSYSEPWIAVDSITSGGCYDAYCVDGGTAGSPWSYDSATSEIINGITSIVQGKIGIYYNYCAASAGSYCWGGSGTSSSGSPSSDPVPNSNRDITDDICPYRWRLPTSESDGEFQNLYGQYNNDNPNQVAAFQTALSTPLSGNFDSGKAHYQGSYGGFWSSTWYGSASMYRLYASSSNVNPSGYNGRRHGNSVRCILAE